MPFQVERTAIAMDRHLENLHLGAHTTLSDQLFFHHPTVTSQNLSRAHHPPSLLKRIAASRIRIVGKGLDEMTHMRSTPRRRMPER